MPIRVTAVDEETGQTAEIVVEPGNYAIIVAAPCEAYWTKHYDDGTTVIRLRGRDPEITNTRWTAPTGGDS